ncbi:hypothetical protein [Roseateles sp.]|uniref:hypothetical protein n=1 Tax=Roseateles sp. TaxID=1971397 RepID=UPI003BA60BBF
MKNRTIALFLLLFATLTWLIGCGAEERQREFSATNKQKLSAIVAEVCSGISRLVTCEPLVFTGKTILIALVDLRVQPGTNFCGEANSLILDMGWTEREDNTVGEDTYYFKGDAGLICRNIRNTSQFQAYFRKP